MKSALQLRYWYRKWNAAYFAGRLPDDTVLLWEPVDGGVAECIPQGAAREIVEGRWKLRIDPALRAKRSLWSMALLHEMVHVSLGKDYNSHGKKFQDEMLRLAQSGAFRRLW